MKTYRIKQLIAIFGALFFLTSCKFEYKKPVYHDPYDLRHNQLRGDVQDVREVEYAIKMAGREAVEGKVIFSRNYSFNPDGKILLRTDTTFNERNETSFQEYAYSRIGKLKSRTMKTRSNDRVLLYKPDFAYMGDAFFELRRERSSYHDTINDAKVQHLAKLWFTGEGLLKKREIYIDDNKFISSVYTYSQETVAKQPEKEKEKAAPVNNDPSLTNLHNWTLSNAERTKDNKAISFPVARSHAEITLPEASNGISITVSATWGSYLELHTSSNGNRFTNQGELTGNSSGTALSTKNLPDGTQYVRFVGKQGTDNSVQLHSVSFGKSVYANNISSVQNVDDWTLDGAGWVKGNNGSLRFETEGAYVEMPALPEGSKNMNISISAIYGDYLILLTSPDGEKFTDHGAFAGTGSMQPATKAIPDGTQHIRFVAKAGTRNDVFLVSANVTKGIELAKKEEMQAKSKPDKPAISETPQIEDIGIVLTESVTTNFNTKRKTTSKYDKYGNLVSEVSIDTVSKKTIDSFTYTYEGYDKAGNWLKRTKFDSRRQPVSVTLREISYHSDAEAVPLFYNLTEARNIGDYLTNIYYRLTAESNIAGTPSIVLAIIVLVLTLLLTFYLIHLWNYYKEHDSVDFFVWEWDTLFKGNLFEDFGGTSGRIWVYNKEPYLKVASLLLILVGGFLLSLIILLAVGAIVWLLFGLLMILFNILNYSLIKWLLAIAAWIGIIWLAFGTIGVLFSALLRTFSEWLTWVVVGGSILAYIFIPFVPGWIFGFVTLFVIGYMFYLLYDDGELGEFFIPILGLILCSVMASLATAAISNPSWLEALGHSTVATGFEFLHSVNLSQWALNLFTNYWDVLLLCFLLPVMIFLAIALLIITFNGLLIGFELIVMRIYSVSRPCPVCGSTQEMYYLKKGGNYDRPYLGKLRPNMYGIFYHDTGSQNGKLPTLLLNGKWKLDRKCKNPNCPTTETKELITSNMKGGNFGMGTPVHIGVVGQKSSGKSFLMYGGLGLLMELYPDRFNQIDADGRTNIKENKDAMNNDGDLGATKKVGSYRAIQLMYKEPWRKIPYHLFCYDVAGETFNTDKGNVDGIDFYQKVQSVMFLIDPEHLNLTGLEANDAIVDWIAKKEIKENEKKDIVNTLSALTYILQTQTGRKTKEIDFHFVCVKKDKGYFEAAGYNSTTITPKEIEKFVREELGLVGLVTPAKAEFKSVNFHAVSVPSKNTSKNTGSLKELFEKILKQRGVKV
jgi:hypothetical protein